MKTLTIKLPNDIDITEAKMLIAGALFEKGILSSEQAAELVGINKRAFLATIGQVGFSVFGETVKDIKQINTQKIKQTNPVKIFSNDLVKN